MILLTSTAGSTLRTTLAFTFTKPAAFTRTTASRGVASGTSLSLSHAAGRVQGSRQRRRSGIKFSPLGAISSSQLVTAASGDRSSTTTTTTFTLPKRDFASQHDKKTDTLVLDPLVVCGPSGVGKGTIIGAFMEQNQGSSHFGFTVSHTTRSPRPGEVNGVHYHFVDKTTMQQLLANDAFLEWAQVHGNYYGTSWQSVLDVYTNQGKRCLFDIDVQGVQRLKALEQEQHKRLPSSSSSSSLRILLQPKYVFIAPPSLQALEERLTNRKTESAGDMQRRLQNAKAEVEYGQTPGNLDAVIVNDNLDQAIEKFTSAVGELYGIELVTCATRKNSILKLHKPDRSGLGE